MTTQITSKTAATLGKLGLPAPVKALARRSWDAIVVGAGHNGLTCAAYLARAGQTEIYLQTAYDPDVAPPGRHVMSMFCQYVPHTFKDGNWDSQRQAAGALAIDALARYCRNLPAAVIDMEVLGPPDVEERVGLSGGHIFQGSCLPDHMWSNRLSPRTPMPGLFLCGACTHPGGSVIAINGLNAAMEIVQG